MDAAAILWTAALSGSYFLGSIPFGLLLSKHFLKTDLRQIGSGNIGATNVLRTGKRGLAALTLLLDLLKGALAVWLTHFCCVYNGTDLSAATLLEAAAGFCAVCGHCYPVWLAFRGGKGVATGLGILLALNWKAGLLVALLWLLMAKIKKISSLAALTAFFCAPFLMFFLTPVPQRPFFFYGTTALALLIFWRHRSNIHRLLKRKEPSIGASA